MKLTNKQIEFVQKVPIVQIDVNWWQMWKLKRAYKKMLKEESK